MKAVILAGGIGTRLFPLTKLVSKQLLPIGGKPMIYYPISLAMLGGIKDILIISQEKTLEQYSELFGNGQDLGINISYKIQEKPIGLANGVYLAKEFVGNNNFLFLLGDNIVHGHGIVKRIRRGLDDKNVCTIFSYFVQNPENFGIIKFGEKDEVIDFIEKPKEYISNWGSIGVYVFPPKIFEYYDKVQFSKRGELEMPELVMKFLQGGNVVKSEKLGRGFVWFDAGTHENYNKANNYINIQEESSQRKVACLEEIAFSNGWITKDNLLSFVKKNKGSYIDYLKEVINEKS